jgi:hypothetical protein
MYAGHLAAGLALKGKVPRAPTWALLIGVGLPDLLMHPADLALWPEARVHLGFGLWRLLPTGWWFVELGFVGAALAYYWLRARRDGTFGRHAGAAACVVIALHLFDSPWLKKF